MIPFSFCALALLDASLTALCASRARHSLFSSHLLEASPSLPRLQSSYFSHLTSPSLYSLLRFHSSLIDIFNSSPRLFPFLFMSDPLPFCFGNPYATRIVVCKSRSVCGTNSQRASPAPNSHHVIAYRIRLHFALRLHNRLHGALQVKRNGNAALQNLVPRAPFTA